MAKTNKIIQSLNSGELSPLMDFRIDQDKYQMGCRTMENFYPLIYGGAERRPGTYYVGAAKTAGVACRLIDFVYSRDQAYILEFGDQYIRVFVNSGRFVGLTVGNNAAWATGTTYYAGDFVEATHAAHTGGSQTDIYRCLISHTSLTGGGDGGGGTPANDANPIQWENSTDTLDIETATMPSTGGMTTDAYPIYEIVSPYRTADLFELKVEQSADVMYICHPDYEPRKLSRISTTTFVLSELDYRDGPFRDVNTVLTALITPTWPGDSGVGETLILTPSGTNADGTTFDPFQTGTTSGHAPSGGVGYESNGTDAVGVSQTNKSITGTLFQIIHANEDDSVDGELSGVDDETGGVYVRKGVQWDATTNGIWSGTIVLERYYQGEVWETIHTVVSADNNNVQVDGTEETANAWYRWRMTKHTSGTALAQISIRDSSVLGVVEITSVSAATPAVATGIIRSSLGGGDATHRWAEGYWSNYRGWPNSVAISSEERLTFAGSPSFPLTVWGSVSGDYTSMLLGVLDDDALIFTLVGSGRQNEILWIVSKNALVLGTYGGEHLLGASDDKEAMTPTNVRAVIQSTYGSEDIQAMMVGDSILYIQRGGRKVREMHYDFAKDSQISDDLTVFSNHITESAVTEVAYQRTPDPMVWCTKGDGQLAVMSYERAQDVYSWCRLLTSTNRGVYTVSVVIQSVADADWITVTATGHSYQIGDNITIYGSTGYDGDYVVQAIATNTFDVIADFLLTGTGSVKGTDPVESDIESVAVIPTSGEEDQIYISIERDVPGATQYDSTKLKRFIEYFSSRDY